MLKLTDFMCEECNELFEELTDKRFEACHICGQPCEAVLSPVKMGNMNDPAKRSEALKKRSAEDTRKEVNKTPERWGLKTSPRKN